MSVRQSLLAILDQGPCYGYQLRSELDRRTASAWPLNVGQVYNTLERLERDGLVRKAGADEQGHVFYEITDAGSADARQWLRSPARHASAPRDELAAKLSLTLTLSGPDAEEMVRQQREASAEELHRARLARQKPAMERDALELAAATIAEARIQRLDAEVRWLDAVLEMLAAAPAQSMRRIELDRRAPKRGRPPAREASGPVEADSTEA